jgi:hypothetical protein
MIIKFYWICLVFLVTIGFIFLASFGFDVDVAFYDRIENLVCNYE